MADSLNNVGRSFKAAYEKHHMKDMPFKVYLAAKAPNDRIKHCPQAW